jgi:hypothetical protein
MVNATRCQKGLKVAVFLRDLIARTGIVKGSSKIAGRDGPLVSSVKICGTT